MKFFRFKIAVTVSYTHLDVYKGQVYYDKENRIYDSNQFSESKMLQTMLLDKEKKVVAIGNPIFSAKIAVSYTHLDVYKRQGLT